MTNAETIWNVISWYYGNSTPIGLLLIVMTVYLLSRKKEYRYYTIGGLFFSFLILNQLTYRVKTRRRKYLLSLSLDVPGVVACGMVFIENPGTHREWMDQSSMCDNGRLSGVPIFGNGDF